MAIRHPPAIQPCRSGQTQRADLPVMFKVEPQIIVGPARAAQRGDRARPAIEGGFEHFTAGPAPVDPQPQREVLAQRRAQFQLAAKPGRRGGALIQGLAKGGRADHHVAEIARLNIAEHIELPVPPTDQPQRGILPALRAVSPGEPQCAVIIIGQNFGLKFNIARNRHHRPQRCRPAIKPRPDTSRNALRQWRGPEPLPPVPAPADHGIARSEPGVKRGGQLAIAPVIDCRRALGQRQAAGRGADHINRPCNRARPKRPDPATTIDRDPVKPLSRQRRKRDMAKERIGHRHAIEHH